MSKRDHCNQYSYMIVCSKKGPLGPLDPELIRSSDTPCVGWKDTACLVVLGPPVRRSTRLRPSMTCRPIWPRRPPPSSGWMKQLGASIHGAENAVTIRADSAEQMDFGAKTGVADVASVALCHSSFFQCAPRGRLKDRQMEQILGYDERGESAAQSFNELVQNPQ